MFLPNEYMHTHDIDWFCVIDNKYCHLASNGSFLPKNFTDEEMLDKVQHEVASMPSRCHYKLNTNYIERILSDNDGRFKHLDVLSEDTLDLLIPMNIDFEEQDLPIKYKVYCWSFIEMAQKGFYSYDWIGDRYQLIAKPTDYKDSEKPPKFPADIPILNGKYLFLQNDL